MIIDHIGIVVASIAEAAEYYERTFGLRPVGGVFTDPRQDVVLQFLADDRGTRIELIQPAGADSPVARALKSGGGLNHVCYRVADLDAAVQAIVAAGAKVVREPVPAVAFEGRRVVFVYTRQRELVEFVEDVAR